MVGQVSGWDRNAHKNHVFFELSEKDAADERDLARVTAVLFGGKRSRVVRKLDEAPESIRMQDGVQVRLLVRVDLYAASGSYQVVVEDVDPDYTLGALALQRERVWKELEKRGVASRNLDLPHPPLPLRLALITSWGSDAANDVLAELRRSGYAFRVDVHDSYMQGENLRSSVCAALQRVAAATQRYDLCLICRGGGSRTDLAWFDDLQVAEAVATLPLKVVVGIGHHRDCSVLDLIAHSEKTPTAAAAHLVASVAACEARLEESAADLVRHAEAAFRGARLDLSHAGARFRRAARSATLLAGELLEGEARRLRRTASQSLARAQAALAESAATGSFLARASFDREQRELGRLTELLGAHTARVLALESQRLSSAAREIQAQDPRRLLARGFAILRAGPDRAVLADAARVEPGSRIAIEMRDGELDARVEAVRRKPSSADEAEKQGNCQ